MAAKGKDGLNDNQRRFLSIYRSDRELNITRSYRKAYPNCTSDNAAHINGLKILRLTTAGAYLKAQSREIAVDRGVKVTVERIIQELKHAAFFDPINLFNDDYSLKSLSDLNEYVRRGIANIKIKRYGPKDKPTSEIIEIKLVGKERALELLGKHLQMFTEKFQTESEEAMYERVKAEIRADGEEAVAMLVANYERLKKYNKNKEQVALPPVAPNKPTNDQPIDLSKLI